MLPDSDHNASLPPDETTDAFLNYQWRRIIVGILERELPKFAPDDTDYQDRINTLIQDIYDLSEPLPMLNVEFKAATKSNTQALTGGSEASVLFNTGDHEASPNVNRIKPTTGKVSITGFVHVTSAVASQLTLAIRKNGTTDVVRQAFANTATAQKMAITVQDECDADDYYELRVLTNQNATIQNTEFAYLKWLRWYVE
jgi:hypothetical protein